MDCQHSFYNHLHVAGVVVLEVYWESYSLSAAAGDDVDGIVVVCTNLKIFAVVGGVAVVVVGKVDKRWEHLRHNILPLLEDLW